MIVFFKRQLLRFSCVILAMNSPSFHLHVETWLLLLDGTTYRLKVKYGLAVLSEMSMIETANDKALVTYSMSPSGLLVDVCLVLERTPFAIMPGDVAMTQVLEILIEFHLVTWILHWRGATTKNLWMTL